ncbi:hypothetical protein BGX26_002499 [Mortierella sp. AD094]|nr:hypothetical protein BGX26_002499 [Mortierella sp. AD094]
MVTINLFLACVMAPLLLAKTAHASFGYCIGINDVSSTKTAYGFYLWNDKGDDGHAYDSSPYNKGLALWNNGWIVEIGAFNDDGMESLAVKNRKYDFDSYVRFDRLCSYTQPGSTRKKFVYYGCYESGNGWCQTELPGIGAACMAHVEMGTDSVGCPGGAATTLKT